MDEVCSPTLGYCVECEGDNDCGADQACFENECRAACTSDKDCTADDGVCNMTEGVCVECNGDPDCGDGTYCASNACVAEICSPGDSFCVADEVSTCSARGDSFSSTTCEDGCNQAGTACQNDDCEVGEAGCDCYPNDTCNDDLECSAGICTSLGSCLGVQGNVCTSIVKFSGTQTVDGSDADFCQVPATVLTFATAEYTAVSNVTADTSISEATLRVAWDETALRAHMHVKDPAFYHSGPTVYDGDNVQFFISSHPPTAPMKPPSA